MKEVEQALIPQPEVEKLAGISRTEIWRRVKNKTFPAPVKLAPRCVRWSKLEVNRWVSDRLAERQLQRAAA